MNIDIAGKRADRRRRQPGDRARDRARVCRSGSRGVDLRARRRDASPPPARRSPGTAGPLTPPSAISPTPRRSRAISRKPPARSAASTFSSTTPRASARATTRPAGRSASRSICWRRCGRSRAALPYLEKSGAGSILNISSISGFRATARTPPYAAVKAAVLEYTLTQAAASRPQRHPRQLHRPRLDRVSRRHLGAGARLNNPDLYGRILGASPLGGWASPRRSRRSHCSSVRRSPAGSPARTSPSMAARCCDSQRQCLLLGQCIFVDHAVLHNDHKVFVGVLDELDTLQRIAVHQ